MVRLRTDPEAIAAYRKALIDSGVVKPVNVETDEQVIHQVEVLLRMVARLGRQLAPVFDAVRVAALELAESMNPLLEVLNSDWDRLAEELPLLEQADARAGHADPNALLEHGPWGGGE